MRSLTRTFHVPKFCTAQLSKTFEKGILIIFSRLFKRMRKLTYLTKIFPKNITFIESILRIINVEFCRSAVLNWQGSSQMQAAHIFKSFFLNYKLEQKIINWKVSRYIYFSLFTIPVQIELSASPTLTEKWKDAIFGKQTSSDAPKSWLSYPQSVPYREKNTALRLLVWQICAFYWHKNLETDWQKALL